MMLLIKQSKSTIFNLQSVSILKKNAFKIAIISFAIFIFGCTENKNTKEEVETNDTIQEQVRQKVLEFSINGKHPQDDSTLLRIAFLGDAEPKPLAEFPNMDS